jgi:membrane associated rhomboid family serine protease
MFGSIWDDAKRNFRHGDTTVQLIFVNVGVWIALILTGIIAMAFGGNMSTIADNYLAVPSQASELLWKPWTVFTYMFTHLDLWHILWNMLFLFWFGRVVSNYVGNSKIIPLFVYGGIAGYLMYFVGALVFPFLFGQSIDGIMIGASAGVSAIMWAAVTLVPRHTFHLVLIGPVEIRYIALFRLLMDLISIQIFANTGGSLSHIGGAILGYIFIRQLQDRNDMGIGLNKFLENMKNYFANINKPKPKGSKQPKQDRTKTKTRKGPKMAYRNPDKQRDEEVKGERRMDTDDQAKIDAILDKIKEAGYDSLGKEEKEFLFKASKK